MPPTRSPAAGLWRHPVDPSITTILRYSPSPSSHSQVWSRCGEGGADLVPPDHEEAAGRPRCAGVLLFFLVVGTVVADQIFNTSGEHTRAFARSLKRYSIPHFFLPSSQTQMQDFIFRVAPIRAHLELQLHHQLPRTPCMSSKVAAAPAPAGTTTDNSDTRV
jgi:hypothetical protein